MTLLPIALISGVVLLIAYRTYGALLARLFRLNDANPVPSQTQRDDQDFIPTEPKFLLGQHFSAIAAAGPIVGPILAGLMFGWVPAILWILVGSIFIGGVHDFASLTASIRHKARSIAEVVREHMSGRAYALFLLFIWLALIYIIVAFTDITSSAFVGTQRLESGVVVNNGGIATSSLLYLLLPVAMGLLMKFARVPLGVATAIFLPLVVLTIWVGQHIPLDLGSAFGVSPENVKPIWAVIILLYCVLAAVAPMWLLLQPRGHLGGYFLFFFLAVGVLGLLFGGRAVEYPAFTAWTTAKGETLAPFLFITIACGAVSGFHSLIASGTTSKQLRRESDAKVIGYGTMLLEAGVAVISLSCVMILAQGSDLTKGSPNAIFAGGISGYLERVGVPGALAFSTMLMAFTTFVYDTLDVCTRLGRYIVQELTGWHDARGKWIGTALTALVPLLFIFTVRQVVDPTGKPIPAWQLFWPLFGASNQLLAALTLLGVTVWLWRTRREKWVLAVAGLPTIFMYAMSCWALVAIILRSTGVEALRPVLAVAVILVGLALWMLIEAIRAFSNPTPRDREPATLVAAA